MPEYLDQICDFVVKTRFEDLGHTIIEQTKKVVYDTVGVIASGARHREPREMSKRLTSLSRGASSTLIGQKKKTDPLQAALINGTAGTWLELDEGNQFARGHAAIHVVPACLAVAEEKKASAKEFLTALVLGYEIACRIGIASKLRMMMHPHGSWGTLGGTVAVGKLMGLEVDQMKTLINIASSMTLATSRKTMLQGGTVRNLYAGVSGYMGILAYHLLESGFTGEADGISSVFGGVVSDSFNPRLMVEELGSRYEITRNYFKEYACCRYNHSSLDALYKIMERRKEKKLAPDQIKRITVETYSLAAQLSSKDPGNMLAAKFSIPFAIATTLVHGHSGVESFVSEKIGQKDIQVLSSLVEVVENPEFTGMMPSRRPARVTVHLKNGESDTETVYISKGDIEDPYSTQELEEKFMCLASPVYGLAAAKEILEKTKRMERFEDINVWTEGL
jgi:2-methylcitrate dehydratase PrpD